MTGDWVFGAIALLALLHGMALLYAYRRGQVAGATREADAREYVTDDGVECPSCGERNEREFQYCRQCVSELPTHVSLLKDSSTPRSRRTL